MYDYFVSEGRKVEKIANNPKYNNGDFIVDRKIVEVKSVGTYHNTKIVYILMRLLKEFPTFEKHRPPLPPSNIVIGLKMSIAHP